MNPKLRLYNRKVLVTGASNGIGRAVVDLFLENGAQVIGLDIEPFKNLDTDKKYDNSFNFFQMNVSKEATQPLRGTYQQRSLCYTEQGMFVLQKPETY